VLKKFLTQVPPQLTTPFFASKSVYLQPHHHFKPAKSLIKGLSRLFLQLFTAQAQIARQHPGRRAKKQHQPFASQHNLAVQQQQAKMAAQHELSRTLAKYLDRHLVFPLLEFLQEKGIYAEDDILKAKIALLQKTNMVDFAMDIHKDLYSTEEVPADMTQRRADVVARLRVLQKAVDPVIAALSNPAVIRNFRQDRAFNLQLLKEEYDIGPEAVDALYQYAKFQVRFCFLLVRRCVRCVVWCTNLGVLFAHVSAVCLLSVRMALLAAGSNDGALRTIEACAAHTTPTPLLSTPLVLENNTNQPTNHTLTKHSHRKPV
jgi:hypothetical protein